MNQISNLLGNETFAALIGGIVGAAIAGVVSAISASRQTSRILAQERLMFGRRMHSAYLGEARSKLIALLANLLSPLVTDKGKPLAYGTLKAVRS